MGLGTDNDDCHKKLSNCICATWTRLPTRMKTLGVISCIITFEVTQPIWQWYLNVTNRQTDRHQYTNTALSTMCSAYIKQTKQTWQQNRSYQVQRLMVLPKCHNKSTSWCIGWNNKNYIHHAGKSSGSVLRKIWLHHSLDHLTMTKTRTIRKSGRGLTTKFNESTMPCNIRFPLTSGDMVTFLTFSW